MSQNQSSKDFSSKQEKKIASYLGWDVVTGSGARNLHPGDIQSDEWLGECKTHVTPGHKIVFYSSVWKKIVDEAVSKYRFPALFVDDGSQKLDNTWVLFNTLPGCKYKLCDYPYSVKTNISFKSLDMMKHKSKLGKEYVIYKLKWKSYNNRVVYITSLKDFFWMF